ncbi:MAG: hypothetical protein ACOVNY_09305 [Chitinophagaceae bacterium]|jgi:prophage maintenance system killer protein
MELQEILFYHQQSIEKYGGSKGIRDEGALQSAIENPMLHLAAMICIQQHFINQQLFWNQ